MNSRSYVINELIEARRMENEGLLNIVVYKVTDAPYTERFAMQLNHISDANCVARIQKLGASGGLDAVIKRVRYLLDRRAEGMPEKPYDVLLPKVSGVPVTSFGYFVEDSRNDIIRSIEEAFSRSSVVILSNLFGFGKKSVIRRYVKSHSYHTAVEVQGMHDSLSNFFLNGLHFSNINDAAFQQGSPRAILQAKFEQLRRLDAHHILVVSDVDIEDDVDEYLLQQLSTLQCHIVFVTQNAADAYRDHLPVIDVGRMETKYLLELFFYYYDRSASMDHAPLIPALERFFDDIGGHTKTVEIAASVLSKEMRTNPDDLVQYLMRGMDSQRTLTDRIVEKLSGLVDMENFSTDVKQTLILIALSADPVIEEQELLQLMELCGLYRRGILTELDNHRWITYNARNRTVHIEPVIAQVCISRLLENYVIPATCFDYLANQYAQLGAKDNITGKHHYSRMAQFARLLHLDAVADVFQTFRGSDALAQNDLDAVSQTSQRFTAWYDALRKVDDEEKTEWEIFAQAVGAWTSCFVLPFLKSAGSYSILFNFRTSQKFSVKNLDDRITDMLLAAVDDPTALAMLCSGPDEEEDEDNEEEDALFSMLYNNALNSILTRDINALNQSFDAIVDYLQDAPQCMENSQFTDAILLIAKVVYQSCCNAGAYHTGIALFERLLSLQWTGYPFHQILMHYARLLVNSTRPAEEAVAVMETAEDLLEEIQADHTLTMEQRENTTREHRALYAYALAVSGQVDAAKEQFTAFLMTNPVGLQEYILDVIDALVDQLLYQQRSDDAIAFVSQHRDFLMDCAENEALPQRRRERAQSCLFLQALSDGKGNADFSAGGIVTDKSYYQRYSAEKKNNPIAMMAYNRVASGVAKFRFTDYTAADFAEHTRRLRERAQAGEAKMKLAAEAFALVSEAGFRTLGYRHHQVQYVGAAAMLDGKISEILNGEGKTYTITLVAYVNSLYNDKVFILDDSVYLTERNYKWMRGLYGLLGLTTGCLIPGADPFAEDPRIIYAHFSSFGFKVLHWENGRQLPAVDLSRCSAIVDEADTLLIEKADTPILISRAPTPSREYARRCRLAYDLACRIRDDDSCYTETKGRIQLTHEVYPLIEEAFQLSLEDITAAETLVKIESLITTALRCMKYIPGEDFFQRGNMLVHEDERSGAMVDFTALWGYYLSLANGLPAGGYEKQLCEQPVYTNMIYVYGLLTRFGTLCGTSATASSFKKEFKAIYRLDVVSVPSTLPLRRIDQTVTLYVTKAHKDAAIVEMVAQKHATEQPVLLIVRNVRESLHFSRLLSDRGICHKVLNAANSEASPDLLASAGVPGSVLIATQIANRGVDIKLGGDPERFAMAELVEQGADLSSLDRILYTASDAEADTDLSRSYRAALERARALVAGYRQKVVAAGGLCVIGTEPYFDMRIEQQIRGRAGRQGDVGESYIFESMDDEVYATVLGNTKEAVLRMFGTDMDIVSSKLLSRSTDNYKERVHHTLFGRMKQAAEVSGRIEASKAEFDRLIANAGDEQTLERLLSLWNSSDENAKHLREALNGEKATGWNAVFQLYEAYPDCFEGAEEKAPAQVLEASARQLLADRAASVSETLVAAVLRRQREIHIDAMYELEQTYSRQSVKNAAHFFAELYRTDLDKRLADSFSTIVYNLLRNKS